VKDQSIGVHSLLNFSLCHAEGGAKNQNELVDSLKLDNLKVANALKRVDRARFIPLDGNNCDYAEPYENKPQIIDMFSKSTLSTPHHHAMIAIAADEHFQKCSGAINVLDVGCGTGYLSAVFATMLQDMKLNDGFKITAVDAVPALVDKTRNLLPDDFIKVEHAYPNPFSKDKFNLIQVGFAIDEPLLNTLIDENLENNQGRIIAPVLDENKMQSLVTVDKIDGALHKTILMKNIHCSDMLEETFEYIDRKQRVIDIQNQLLSWKQEFMAKNNNKPPSRDEMFNDPVGGPLFIEFSKKKNSFFESKDHPNSKMTEFKKLRTTTFAKNNTVETAEEKYWNKFKVVKPTVKLPGPVTSIALSPVPCFDYAASASARVIVYDGTSGKLKKSLARFKNIALGGAFRYDGKLFAAGCENNFVYVYNSTNGSLMRVFKTHTAPVHCTMWADQGSHLFTCSDDKTVRYFDVASESELQVFRGHSDLVRSATKFESTWASGSYDHTVRLWDVREEKAVNIMQCLGPIESILAVSPTKLAASSGNKVQIWDIVAGKPLLEICNHQKTVTTLFMDGTETRFLSGSLDGIIKVHDATTFSHTASITIGSGQGILSAAVTKNNGALVVGCVSGEILVHRKPLGKVRVEEVDEVPSGGTHRYFMRGGNVGPSASDFKVGISQKSKLAPFDKHLRKFNYKQALDDVLKSRTPVLVVALLDELNSRKGLQAALAGRDDTCLEPVLSFVVKFITNPRFAPVLIKVSEIILNIYSRDLGHSVLIDEVFTKLQQSVKQEIKLQQQLFKLCGSIDLLVSNN